MSHIKPQKCQPADWDTLVTGSVPVSGLARQTNIKPKIHGKLRYPDDKWTKDILSKQKTQKCQPADWDTLVTESVPGSGLARHTNQITLKSEITQNTRHPDDKWTKDVLTKQKSQKCQPADWDTLVTESVPVSGLARHTKQITHKSTISVKRNHPDDKWTKDELQKQKLQKCQPAVWDTLVQQSGGSVPDSGLARPQKKINRTKKFKNNAESQDVTLIRSNKLTKQSSTVPNTKTKKCQPVAGDMPDLIQTEHVPSKGLARPKKNIKHENNKMKICMESTDVTLVNGSKLTKSFSVQSNTKTKKCQPTAGDMPDLIKTVHVPSRGLTRHQKKINKKNKMEKKCSKFRKPTLHRQHSQLKIRMIWWLLLWGDTSSRGKSLVSPPSDSAWTWTVPDRDTSKVTTPSRSSGTMTVSNVALPDFLVTSHISDTSSVDQPHWTSHKLQNKKMKIQNGNIEKKISIIHWNIGARLWTNKLDEIELLLSDKQPDLCFISEANLWANTEGHLTAIPGYDLILPNTMKKWGHARIVLLAKIHLNITKLNQYMEDDLATIWVRVGATKKSSVIVGGVYRQHKLLGEDDDPPNWLVKQEERWTRLVNNWRRAGLQSNCVVIGDINLDWLMWDTPNIQHTNMVEKVQDEIETTGHVQLVRGHTRSWHHQKDSCLDHIWTNRKDRSLRHFNEIRGDSDHNCIGIDYSSKDIKVGGFNVKRRLWQNFSEVSFVNKVKSIDWTDVLAETDVNIANFTVEEKLREILDSEAPMRVIQMRTRNNKWIKAETKIEMSLRDNARATARLSDTDDDWAEYRRRRNMCTKMQRNDKKQFLTETFSRLESTNDTAGIYASARDILGIRRAGPPLAFLQNGNLTRKQSEVANIQMQYYHDKVKSIRESLPLVMNNPLAVLDKLFTRWSPVGGKPSFSLKSVTTQETLKIIKNLKNSHAFGTDELDAASIKLVAPILAPVFAHVINLSLGTNHFPMRWKISRIVPLLKSSELDKTNPKSFRPIAQLPLISKLAERVIQVQMLEYLENTDQLHPNHHTYRIGTSTTSALIQLADFIATGADANKITSTMTTDLSAAFDSVNHEILIEKIKYYGFDYTTVNWIKSYLANRTAYVVVGSAQSNMKTTTGGVPQGSCLGPLLYLLFINELPSVINDDLCGEVVHQRTSKLFTDDCKKCGTLLVFADDSQFLLTNARQSTNQDRLDEVFVTLKNFFNDSGLQLNETKTSITEYMTHQKRSKLGGIPPDLTVKEHIETQEGTRIDDKLLTDSCKNRFLGLNFQNNGSWEAHLSTGKKPLLPALRQQLGMLSKLRNTTSQKVKLQLVNGLILSRLNYMICIWGNTSHSTKMKAQTVLNAAARFVSGARKTTRIATLMEECGWLTIDELTTYFSLMSIWKTIMNQIPQYMTSKIQTDTEMKISTSPPRLLGTSLSYRWSTISKWNLLPESLRRQVQMKKFKTGVKKWIKERRTSNQDHVPEPVPEPEPDPDQLDQLDRP